jgi:glycosyltransferase involved in cell wall biosynthesis
VATDVGGCGEMIEPGVTGYLADPGDRGALAGRVLQLLSSPDRGRAMGEAGRRRAYAQFGVDTLGPMFEELYRRLLSQAAGRAA